MDLSRYPVLDYDYYSYGVDLDPSEGTEFLFWTEGVILTVVSLFGIVGTLMSVGVIVRRDVRYIMQPSSDICQKGLS